MAYPVNKIADELIRYSAERGGELMTNMKLNKMLYYQQGFHLAYFGNPLFDDEIEAWMYGPVVPSIYEKYDRYNSSGIEPNKDSNFLFDNPKELALFNEVFKVYNVFSAIGLMNMTHNEAPWKTTKIGEGNVISKDKMKVFFKKRLKN